MYFLGANSADEPLLREVVAAGKKKQQEENSSPTPSELGSNVAAKFAAAKKAPLQGRREEKGLGRGASVHTKR